MKRTLGLAAALAAVLYMKPAHACGGFFCSQQPVDQAGERILFAENPDGSTTMIVQIDYAGGDKDFSWILPLGSVPDVASLAVFPQLALTALDSNSGPQFQMPDDPQCSYWDSYDDDGIYPSPPQGAEAGGVTVDLQAEVGPYGVVVVESEDPAALTTWLAGNGYRVTRAMDPYIKLYTDAGMKFLALKLKPGADVSQIQPFRFSLPGAPSIPLRLTALAAEPEMGIEVFYFGTMRLAPANWPDLTVDDTRIVWNPYSWSGDNNWSALVAKTVDEAGGQGFVTELAGATRPFLDQVQAFPPPTEEGVAAQKALVEIMTGRPFFTRLYTRLSAEEMTSDPIFKRSWPTDVSNVHKLSRVVDGIDLCAMEHDGSYGYVGTPCDFTTCGAGGLCREVHLPNDTTTTGCACVPGATARTTFSPNGSVMVACQDLRMSFLNPGDIDASGVTLADPCLGFDCGGHGTCTAVNMTPTCLCEQGFVAIGALATNGNRQTTCARPKTEVPASFYEGRLPDVEMPGREIIVPPAPTHHTDGCAVGGQRNSLGGSLSALLLALLAFAKKARR